MTEPETTGLAFDVDAALLVELGERLVTRRSVALAELIKNAYDADATEVIVRFDNLAGSERRDRRHRQRVWDESGGHEARMDADCYNRCNSKCAVAGGSVDREPVRKVSADSRAEGWRHASRFDQFPACLEASSVSAQTSTGTIFKAGLDLTDIKTDIVREPIVGKVPTGTTLHLSELANTWTKKDLADLQQELCTLIDPYSQRGYVRRGFEHEADPGFEAQLQVPEFEEYAGGMQERFLGAAWGVLEGQVTNDGKPQYKLNVRDSDVLLRLHPPDLTFEKLAGAVFTVQMMVYSASRFKGSGYSLQVARSLGRERGGVRILPGMGSRCSRMEHRATIGLASIRIEADG